MKKRVVTAVVAVALLISQTAVFAEPDFDEYDERAEIQLLEDFGRTERPERFENAEEVALFEQKDENVELFSDGDFEYSVNDDGTVKITDYNGSDTELIIPSEIDGKTVTEIGGWAFYNCSSLKSVTIPDSVTEIGDSVFSYCSSLTSVIIHDSVTKIGRYAFYKCSSLKSVTIPDSVTEIGDSAFYNCESITSFTVSENNANYTSQDGVLFNKAMTELMYYPLGSSKAEYTIPNSVTEIGDSAFEYCSSLKSVTIPDSVTKIGDSAFWGCSSLTSVIIHDSVTKIGRYAFYKCSSLKSVTIPDSVTEIDDSAFKYCESITSFTVSESNANYTSQDGVLFNKTMTELVNYPVGSSKTEYTIPDSVTTIGDYAFNSCSSLKSVTIPDSVMKIGRYVFNSCKSMTSFTVSGNNVNYTSQDGVLFNKAMMELMYYPAGNSRAEYIIPSGVTAIDGYAFYNCSSLKSITIPDSVTKIGWYAFEYCSSLKSVTIPGSVTEIDDSAFNYCKSITSFTVSENNANYTSQDGVLFNKTMTELVNYPVGSSKTEYTIPDSVMTIGDYAFYYCSSLKSVTIPDSVTKIGSGTSYIVKDGKDFVPTFYGCDNLTIYGNSGSCAENYAKANDVPFVSIGQATPTPTPTPTPSMDNPKLNFGDVTLEKPTVSYSDNKVTTSVSLSTDKDDPFTVYVTCYDDSGVPVAIKQISVTDNSYSGNVEIGVNGKPAYVKVFAFDATNIVAPVCNSEKVELN